MDISKNGLALIENFEGWVPHVYSDVVGIKTIGYGHVVLPGESFPNGITKEQGEELLHHDSQKCVVAINAKVTVQLTQNQFDSLCSFAFNVGVGALEGSTLLKLVNEGDFTNASLEFTKWAHAGGQINAVLLARRKKEAVLFLTPDAAQTVFIEPPEPTIVEPIAAPPFEPSSESLSPVEMSPKAQVEKFTITLHWIVLFFGFWAKFAHEVYKHFK